MSEKNIIFTQGEEHTVGLYQRTGESHKTSIDATVS